MTVFTNLSFTEACPHWDVEQPFLNPVLIRRCILHTARK